MFQLEKSEPVQLSNQSNPPKTLVKSFSWAERNCSEWAKQRLKELLSEVAAAEEDVYCKIKKINNISGELTVYNKKGKRFCSYDLEVAAEYQAQVTPGQGTTGDVYIPHIGEEYKEDEFEIQFAGDEPIKGFAKEMLDPIIRQKVIQMLKELCEEYEIEKTFPQIEKPSLSSFKAKVRDFKRKKTPIDPSSKGYKTIGSAGHGSTEKKATNPNITTTTSTTIPQKEKSSEGKEVSKQIPWLQFGKYSLLILGVIGLVGGSLYFLSDSDDPYARRHAMRARRYY